MHSDGATLFKDIIVIFGLAVLVMLLFQRFRLPAVIGLIVTGVVAGPHGFGLVSDVPRVELLAEIGVIMLLFSIGMEFSQRNMDQIKSVMLIGGPLQVLLTTLATTVAALAFGFSLRQGIFFGFLVSLSSTAIVLKILQEKADIDKHYGRTAVGMLIFQDLAVVPMMLLVPLIAGTSGELFKWQLLSLLIALVVVTGVTFGSQWAVPRILFIMAKSRSSELFLITLVFICLAVAYLTSLLGLSLALGAFLAGLIIARSEYSHQALSNILPFRDIFTSLFFVSIGMLFNLNTFAQSPVLVLSLVAAVLLVKSLLAALAATSVGLPIKSAITTGLALSQVGEFSFVLAITGIGHQLINEELYQIFLAVSLLTMALTPIILAFGQHIAGAVARLPLPAILNSGWRPVPNEPDSKLTDHVIIIGYGINGRNLARSTRHAAIPYIILEMNPETVRMERSAGQPIMFGDATHQEVLKAAFVSEARVVAVVIDDPISTRRIIEAIRRLNTSCYLIVRTRYLKEVRPMLEMGANDVIPEEFETSIEIFARVLRKYLVSRADIDRFIAEVRSDQYQIFRDSSNEPAFISSFKMQISDMEVEWFKVAADSPAAGKTLSELELRHKHAVTVLLIRRSGQNYSQPAGDTRLLEDDIVFVLGAPQKIMSASRLFNSTADSLEPPANY